MESIYSLSEKNSKSKSYKIFVNFRKLILRIACCYLIVNNNIGIIWDILDVDKSLISNYNIAMSTTDTISLISKIREKVNKRIITEMEKYGMEGIVTSHGDILDALNHRGKMTMAEVAEAIGKDKSTVTALVEKLVRLGYVAKERDAVDTRIIYVTLTPKGNDLKPAFNKISKEVLEAFYTGISEEEKEVLCGLLNRIYSNL